MKDINEMTEQEWLEFEMAMDKEDWKCEHNRLFSEDCKDCDEEWGYKTGEVVTGTIVEDETNPVKCDHGIDLNEPGYGKCSQCDSKCYNTISMSAAAIHRLANQKKWRYSNVTKAWVELPSQGDSNWQNVSSKSKCKHFMQEFKITDEHSIFASADRDAPYHEKRNEKDYPDVGMYLYSGWVSGLSNFTSTTGLDVPWTNGKKAAPWPMAYLEWHDYGVPESFDTTITVLEWTWQQILDGKRVETGCLGGHGRTGTFLALLLVKQGVKPGTACTQVWDEYCEEAIESKSQVELIVRVYEHYHGKKWKQSKIEREIINDLLKPPKKSKKSTSIPVVRAEDKDAPKCLHGRLMTEPCVACEYQGWH